LGRSGRIVSGVIFGFLRGHAGLHGAIEGVYTGFEDFFDMAIDGLKLAGVSGIICH